MNWYLWLKALHVIAVISWMAGMLYLPRLFVYHVEAPPGSQLSETFKIMERRLLRIIINPAMILVWLTGLSLAFAENSSRQDGSTRNFCWFWLCPACMAILAKITKEFARDGNQRSAIFYRQINEIPTILMIAIVVLVIVKPF